MATKKSNDEMHKFRATLLKTKREGVDELLNYMEERGFFTAPCSGAHHLAKEGGLLKHSLNVLHLAEKLSVALYGASNLDKDLKNSIAICALLHDLGKMGQFDKPNYVPNILKSGGQSVVKPFETNKELLPIPHEVRSVAIAQMFIDLTEDEQFAILYHNGLYGDFKYDIRGNETPLYLIIHTADMWASRVTEVEKKEEE